MGNVRSTQTTPSRVFRICRPKAIKSQACGVLTKNAIFTCDVSLVQLLGEVWFRERRGWLSHERSVIHGNFPQSDAELSTRRGALAL